jgi:D-amino-acid dehydrogenase
MRVVVVGAGVIGLWCARDLAAAGIDVTVVGPAAQPAVSTPASAGWVVPVLAAPLSGPGLVGSTVRQLVRRQAAFSFRRPTPGLGRWLWDFYRSGSAEGYREGLRASLRLASGCVDDYLRLKASGLGFELHHDGLVMVARTERGLEDGRSLVTGAEAEGYQGRWEELGARALLGLEPSLAPRVVGGIHARDELHVEPTELLTALTADVTARGVTVRDDVVTAVTPAASGRWTVRTSRGDLTADRVVVAAGYWSKHLAATMGARLPLQSAAGYSITATGPRPPRLPLKLIDANVAVTPFGNGVRLAGRFSLGQPPSTVSARQVRRVIEAARPYFAAWRPENVSVSHVGLRPATPDSLPLLGELPGRRGVVFATGHGMLGLTLAPGTAAEVVRQITTGEPSELGAALRPGRYGSAVTTVRERVR